MVDCGGLENRWARKGPGGSNPSPSAMLSTSSSPGALRAPGADGAEPAVAEGWSFTT